MEIPTVTECIEAYQGGREPVLEELVLGTRDLRSMAHMIEMACQAALDSPVTGCLFYRAGVGIVAGVRLPDDRQALIKVHQPDRSRDYLAAMQRVQRHLSAAGYPAPRPMGMAPCGLGTATFEELLDLGALGDAHKASTRRAMAESLAVQVRLATEVEDTAALDHAPLRTWTRLWITPHSPIFDFERTARGAEWIDELATRAMTILRDDPGRHVVGHVDWRVEQMRFMDGEISAIYDWDSLFGDTETTIVGFASRAFPMAWEQGTSRLWPTPEEQVAFIAEYEAVRGQPFTLAERRAIAAAGVYLSAYGARCEHAVSDAVAAIPPDSQREGLAAHQRELFDILN